MQFTFVVFATLLLGAMGRMPSSGVQDIGMETAAGQRPGKLGDVSDERSGREKIAGIKKMMEKKQRRGGPKLKGDKMPPTFGGRDKPSKRATKATTRNVQANHGPPGNMRIPPQEIERRRSPQDHTPPRRKPKQKPSVRESASKIKSARKHSKDPDNGRRPSRPMLHLFDIVDGQGKTIRLDKEYFPRAKIFLIVNIASESEFMWQLAELETLYSSLGRAGLEIIAFPSNSFKQEPLDDGDIKSLMSEKYDITFPVMAKCDVNGDNAHPLWQFLKRQALGGSPKVPEWSPLEESGLAETDVQWNFEKYMVHTIKGRERVMRFPFDLKPSSLMKHIERTIEMANRRKKEL